MGSDFTLSPERKHYKCPFVDIKGLTFPVWCVSLVSQDQREEPEHQTEADDQAGRENLLHQD